ncbi:unnamed protein product [Rhizophagus irregularis]|uniref:Uncharacterized protein n=1 Tax=Rhizophagus irregularis TaxID=588596 RepID=A0A916EDL1_9GLOM|nr:unnamed protein product [Rhizophagus irregularis]CAB5374013.1 unnamed protein product [Rhizophagus irregularis]
MISSCSFIKETFLYCPPSCKRIVEYDVEELLAIDLSTINHPIDIAPVIRELKESSNGNLVYRIKRKHSDICGLKNTENYIRTRKRKE